MMMNKFAALVAVMVLSLHQLNAQSTFGSILGVVRDPSGSAVAKATISVRDIDANITRPAVSNQEGLYQVLNLKPGRYEITATAPGFSTTKIAEVTLTSRQELRADLKLELGAVSQAVEVNARGTQVNTENGTISDTKTGEQIRELPLNYRGASTSALTSMMSTVPGVQGDGTSFSIAGGIPSQGEYTVDGISIVSNRNHGPLAQMFPSSEMLGEFRVTSVNNNAEFSQMGDVTATTKSGSNRFHGSAFEYLQNAALDATTYGSLTKQHKVWNAFGGSVSGPIWRNHTFFFGTYEGNRQPGSQLQILSVPTAAIRTGNLAGLPGGSVIDPATGAPFQGNQIPTIKLNPVAVSLLTNYYPLPNTSTSGTNGNYRVQSPVSASTNLFDTRIDHKISNRQLLFGRLSWNNQPSQQVNGLLPNTSLQNNYRNMVVSHSYTLKPNLLNEFRFGFSLWSGDTSFPIKGADVLSKLGITGLNTSNHPDAEVFPNFNFSSGTGFASIGNNRAGSTLSRTYQFNDNLSWIRGSHSLKFGADVRRYSLGAPSYYAGADDYGNFTFQANRFSGNAFADFLLGLPYSTNFSVTPPDTKMSSVAFGVYAQDEWRVSHKLTVSFGLRWELHPPFSEENGDLTNFDRVTGNVVVPDKTVPSFPGFLTAINACPGTNPAFPCTHVVSASQAGLPEGLRHTYYHDFNPRLSIAWRPFGDSKTVFRGGFGVFTQTLLGPRAYSMTGIHTGDTETYTNYQGPGKPPLWVLPQISAGAFAVKSFGTTSLAYVTDPNFRDPRTYQWTFTAEREVSPDTVFRISYVGSNSVGLTMNVNLNQIAPSTTPFTQSRLPYPNFRRVASGDNLGFANYQAMQVELSKRLSRSLFFQTSYVLAKDLGNVEGPNIQASFPVEYGSWITNRWNTRYDRGNLGGIRRNRFQANAIYQLPFGKTRRFGSSMNGLGEAVLGGWQLSTVTLIQSGPYLTALSDDDPYDQANSDQTNWTTPFRPDRIGNGNIANPTPNHWWDQAAFAAPPNNAGRLGNSGVGILKGPGEVAISAGLAKVFTLREGIRLRFEASFTNLPNHPNFAPPGVDITTPSFGKTLTVSKAENGGNRTGQLGLRLDF